MSTAYASTAVRPPPSATIRESAPVLELQTLGAALMRGPDGRTLQGLGAKGFALLAFLALQPGRSATRDVLVDLLWARGAPEQGRASLRQELRRMKRALGGLFDAVLETPGGQVALRQGAVISDYQRVETACAARDTASLAALLDHYGGAFLAPLSVPEIAFQDWVAERNSHVEAIALDGLLRLMLLDESAGRLERAATAARALLAIDALQEDVHAALVRIHVSSGRLPQARRQADICRAVFREELGEPPDTDFEAILAGAAPERARPAGRSAAPPPGRPAARPRGGTGAGGAPDRPLVAVAAAPGPSGEGPLCAAVRMALLGSLESLAFMRAVDAEALGGGAPAALLDRADYLAVVSAEDPPRAGAVTLSRRGDGACAAARRIVWPLDGEAAAEARLGADLAGAAAADMLAAETAAAGPGGGAWGALMRARAALADAGPTPTETARETLEALAREAPDDPATLCHLALSHLQDGWSGWSPAPREALFRGRETALRAVRRAPGSPWAQHVYGLGCALMQDAVGGRLHQLRALELAPGFAPAVGELARLLALGGDVAEADERAARALALAPRAPETAYWLRAPALARFARGDLAGAEAAAERAAAARPDWALNALLIAACRLEAGDAAGADAALAPAAERLSQVTPQSVRLGHAFEDPDRIEALMAPLGRL